jgi:ribA/ribD-fused uncharacterized protein
MLVGGSMAHIFDMVALRSASAAGEPLAYRLFWGHRARKDGALGDSCFSQWWRSRFVVDGQPYSSAEQYMMAGKARLFADDETLAQILAADDPGRVKALGRRVRNFDEATWTAARFDIVTVGSVEKFGQDERLRRYLLATRDEILVEASPLDLVWGIGLAADHEDATRPERWPGLNLLGFALMRGRAILRGELPRP